jgi:hypothetical protein
MSQTAFAAHIGRSRQYVGKLKLAGRLALTRDGRIKVKESLELIEATKGARDDVAERNAAERGATPAAGSRRRMAAGDEIHAETLKEAARLKALAESRRVQAVADREEMERDRLAGNLIPREEVDAAFRFIGAQVRALADVYPDQTAPLVAPVADLHEVHAILADTRRNELVALGEAIEKQRSALGESRNG